MFSFAVATVGMLKFLKKLIEKSSDICIQVDETHSLTLADWVSYSIVIYFNDFDATKGVHARRLLQNIFLITLTENQLACEYFFLHIHKFTSQIIPHTHSFKSYLLLSRSRRLHSCYKGNSVA